MPVDSLGVSSEGNLLPHPRTVDTGVHGLRSSPLNDRVTHAQLHGADHGRSTPAATSCLPSHDLEGSLLVRIDTTQDIEITRLMDSIELVAIEVGPVRISPTTAVDPSSEFTTSKDSTGEVKDGNVGLLGGGTSLTFRIVTNSLREVVTSNQTSGAVWRILTLESSVILDDRQGQGITPDGERVHHTVEVSNAARRRVTDEVSVQTLRGEGRVETVVRGQGASLVNSVNEDLSTGSGSIVDEVNSDVVPAVHNVELQRGGQNFTSKANSKTTARIDEHLNILGSIFLALAEQDQRVLGGRVRVQVGLNFKTQLTILANEGRGQTDVTSRVVG